MIKKGNKLQSILVTFLFKNVHVHVYEMHDSKRGLHDFFLNLKAYNSDQDAIIKNVDAFNEVKFKSYLIESRSYQA